MPRCRVFLSRPYCLFLLFLKLQEVEINESRADGVVDAVMMQQQSPTQQLRKKSQFVRHCDYGCLIESRKGSNCKMSLNEKE